MRLRWSASIDEKASVSRETLALRFLGMGLSASPFSADSASWGDSYGPVALRQQLARSRIHASQKLGSGLWSGAVGE